MPFKYHLIIITIITAIVYGVWEVTQQAPVAGSTTIVEKTVASPYRINIISATWGNNCKEFGYGNEVTGTTGFADLGNDNTVIRENNVLETVSRLCNEKVKCVVPLIPETFGINPIPDCPKDIEIEYRCFSFDRPWKIKAAEKAAEINCDRGQPITQQAPR